MDECTGPRPADWLRGQQHEVFSVYEQARGTDDEVLIQKAFTENWILITNDKDSGEKVFRERRPHRGIVFLRLDGERAASKISVLQQLLDRYGAQPADQFVVVTENQVRFAGLPAPETRDT